MGDYWDEGGFPRKKGQNQHRQGGPYRQQRGNNTPTGLTKSEKKKVRTAIEEQENDRVARTRRQARWNKILKSWEDQNIPTGFRHWGALFDCPIPDSEIDRFQRLDLTQQYQFLVDLDTQVAKQKKIYLDRVAYAREQQLKVKHQTQGQKQKPGKPGKSKNQNITDSSDELYSSDEDDYPPYSTPNPVPHASRAHPQHPYDSFADAAREHASFERPPLSHTYVDIYGLPARDFPQLRPASTDDDLDRAIRASLAQSEARPAPVMASSGRDHEEAEMRQAVALSQAQRPSPNIEDEELQAVLALSLQAEQEQQQKQRERPHKLPSEMSEEEQLRAALQASQLEDRAPAAQVSEEEQMRAAIEESLTEAEREEKMLAAALRESVQVVQMLPPTMMQTYTAVHDRPGEQRGEEAEKALREAFAQSLQAPQMFQRTGSGQDKGPLVRHDSDEESSARRTVLRIYLPTGLSVQKRFKSDAGLFDVHEFIRRESGLESFRIRSNLSADLNNEAQTLEQLGLAPSAVLYVEKR